MIQSYLIETFDHGSFLLAGNLKTKCLLKTCGGESCCSLREIESRENKNFYDLKLNKNNMEKGNSGKHV